MRVSCQGFSLRQAQADAVQSWDRQYGFHQVKVAFFGLYNAQEGGELFHSRSSPLHSFYTTVSLSKNIWSFLLWIQGKCSRDKQGWKRPREMVLIYIPMRISYIWLKILQPILKALHNISQQYIPALYFPSLSALCCYLPWIDFSLISQNFSLSSMN